MILLVKYIENGLGLAILDVIVDGEGDALDGVLEVGLGHGAVVYIDGGAGGGLLQSVKVAQGVGVGQLHLGPLPHHSVPAIKKVFPRLVLKFWFLLSGLLSHHSVPTIKEFSSKKFSVLRIRTRRIFRPPGSGSIVRCRYGYGSGSGSFYQAKKNSKKNLDSFCFVTSL
jgi:hypothetical protein